MADALPPSTEDRIKQLAQLQAYQQWARQQENGGLIPEVPVPARDGTERSLQTLMDYHRGDQDSAAAINTMPQWTPPGVPRMPKANRLPTQRPSPNRLIDG